MLEYRYYNDKGKALRDAWRNERFTRLTVEKMWGDSIANVAIENETFERLKNSELLGDIIGGINYGDVRQTPTEVVFENVMWTFVPEDMDKTSPDAKPEDGFGGFDVTLGATARLPRKLNVGDTLPDENYKAVFAERVSEQELDRRKENPDELYREMLLQEGEGRELPLTMVLEVSTVIRGRRVVGRERVETPAGEFECWKIEYEMIGPSTRYPGYFSSITYDEGHPQFNWEWPVPPIIKHVDYISPEVGLVRREKMNGTGRRIDEVMVLEVLK